MSGTRFSLWSFTLSAVPAVLAILFLSTCGKKAPTEPPGPAVPPPPVPVATRITITPSPLVFTSLATTQQLTAVVYDQNGQVLSGLTLTWSSGDASVVSVTAQGVARSNGVGNAMVTARSGNASATVEAKVAQTVATVRLSPSTLTIMEPARTGVFSATVLDAGGTAIADAQVTWSSSDSTVATVNAAGVVTAVGSGMATISATLNGITAEGTVMVALRPATLAITPPTARLKTVGQTLQLVAIAQTGEGAPIMDPSVEWTSSNESVASVSAEGLVTAHRTGRATITASLDSLAASAEIEVALPPHRVAVTPPSIRFDASGQTIRLSVEVFDVLDALLLDASVSWSSDDPSVATVGPNGTVTAVSAGTTRIAARSGDANGYAEATVNLDRQALTALYHATDGPNWNRNDNWLNDGPLDQWYGVSIGLDGRVDALVLASNGLTGAIPPELGDLVNLRQFIVSNTRLSGPLPETFTALENLETIWLQGTRLCVPATEAFDRWLSRIRFAIVSPCDNPDEAALVELYHATDGPNWKDGTNWLTDTPLQDWKGVAVDRFGRVNQLFLGENGLRGELPASLGDLEFLRELFLHGNALHGKIPPELGGLRNLKQMLLSGNNLNGSIPPDLGKLYNLGFLFLDENEFEGAIPSELGELDGLRQLYLQENLLSGEIPPELGRMSSLTELNLGGNLLSGELPTGLGNLASLRELVLSGNERLTGVLPPALIRLDLDVLLAEKTGLCLSAEVDYASWVLGYRHVRVERCGRPEEMGLTAYLTQATQSFDHPVPLVAGDPALLRVFLTADGGDVEVPPVRASFYHNGSNVHTVDIPGRAGIVPALIDESDLALTSNAMIPGSIIAPGLEMVVEIDPDETQDVPEAVKKRLPETGRIRLDVKDMPPMDLVMVPFLWEEDPDHAFVSTVEALTAEDEIFGQTRNLLPVGEFNLEVHAPVWTSVDPVVPTNVEESVTSTAIRLFQDLEVIQAVEGSGRVYYMGVLREYGGRAGVSQNISLASLHESVIAHELGHNLSLSHTGCTPMFPDPNYPYEDGAIGSWGYDIRTGMLVSPETTCLMSYCGTEWIGEYSFSKALYYRLSENARLTSGYDAAAPGLLIWGGVTADGEMTLEPAFPLTAPPSLPAAAGPYSLHGEDDKGRILFTLRFPMSRFAHAEGGTFAFILPVRPDRISGLTRVSLSGPEGAVEITRDDDRAAVLMIDRHTGEVRGILREWLSPGGSYSAGRRILPQPGLDVIISRGIP